VNLDNNPLNLYNKGVSVPNGTFNQDVSCETSGSNECTEYKPYLGLMDVGANYEITPHMSVFARINQGVHFPGFDDLRSGTPQTQGIKNYEVGYRVQTEFYGVVDVFIAPSPACRFSSSRLPVNKSQRATAPTRRASPSRHVGNPFRI
jgi:hypothetical protein